MKNDPTFWRMDDRLNADTSRIGVSQNIEILLMNDSRWPWIILVPRQTAAADLDDLDARLRGDLFDLASFFSGLLKNTGLAQSTNVATLSNIVTQFHLHIVGRHTSDPAWPGPVWGFEECVPYEIAAREALITQLAAAMTEAFQFSSNT